MSKKGFQIVVVCLLAFTMLGAGNPSTSFDKVGHQLICQCGCGQILLECNHVGCPVSGPMIEELKVQMATGLPATGVLNWFVGKYGPIVLAAPIRGGFDNAAWIVPFVVALLGFAGVFFVARLWKRNPVTASEELSNGRFSQDDDALRERIRRETDLT